MIGKRDRRSLRSSGSSDGWPEAQQRARGIERLRELEGRSERTCSKLKKTDYLSWGTPHRLVKMDRIKDTPVVKLLLLLPRHT